MFVPDLFQDKLRVQLDFEASSEQEMRYQIQSICKANITYSLMFQKMPPSLGSWIFSAVTNQHVPGSIFFDPPSHSHYPGW